MFGKLIRNKILWLGAGVLTILAVFAMVGACTLEPSIADIHKEVQEANPYTVTFMADGAPIATQKVVIGHKAEKPDNPTASGKTFGWWFTDDGTFTTPWDFQNNTITGNKTLYAKFNDDDSSGNPIYSIVFFAKEGTPVFEVVETTGSPATITNPTIAKVGYTADWNTKSDGSGTPFIIGGGTPTAIPESIAVYAKWTPITYEVAYDSNTGSGSMSNSTFTYNTSGRLTTNAFTAPASKYFLGWGTSTGVSPVIYTDGQSVMNLSSTQDEVVTLYAQWGIIISYDAAAADGVSNDSDTTEILLTNFSPVLTENLSQSEVIITSDTGVVVTASPTFLSTPDSGGTWVISLSKVTTQGDVTVKINHREANGNMVDNTLQTVAVYKQLVGLNASSDSSGLVRGDGKITNLEAGKYYKVIDDATGTLYYVTSGSTAGGTLTPNLGSIGIPTNGTITDLDNTKTYTVNAAVPLADGSYDVFDHSDSTSNPGSNMPILLLTSPVSISGGDGTLSLSPDSSAVLYGINLAPEIDPLTKYVIWRFPNEPSNTHLDVWTGARFSGLFYSGNYYDPYDDSHTSPLDVPNNTVGIYQYNATDVLDPIWLNNMSIIYAPIDNSTTTYLIIKIDYLTGKPIGDLNYLKVVVGTGTP